MPKSSLTPLLATSEQACSHFTDTAGQAFARFRASNSGGCYLLPLRSREYREWFLAAFYGNHSAHPSPHAFRALLHHLEAQADADDCLRRFVVFRRVGSRGPNIVPDQILIDLANPRGEFIEISPKGYRTATAPDVNFQTSRSSRPLPAPEPPPPGPRPLSPAPVFPPLPAATPEPPPPRGADTSLAAAVSPACDPAPSPLAALRSLLNLSSHADFLRCLAWLLAALRPNTPYPVLILQGPPSSGKSFAARVLRYLVDPSIASFNPVPSSVRQLLDLANQNWILSFDHISNLSPTLSDALCRLSSLAGVALRETPASQPILLTLRRPILLSVTQRFSCPDDLAERALTASFAPLPASARRAEEHLIAAFEPLHPRILAALCNAVSTALRRLPGTMAATGRCPDALAWAMAAAPALGCTEDEMRDACNAPPPPDPTVEAARTLVADRGSWSGTATHLLDLVPPSPHFHSAKGLSQHLRSHTPHLADLGIALQFSHPKPNLRLVDLTPIIPNPPSPRDALLDASPDVVPDVPPDVGPPPQSAHAPLPAPSPSQDASQTPRPSPHNPDPWPRPLAPAPPPAPSPRPPAPGPRPLAPDPRPPAPPTPDSKGPEPNATPVSSNLAEP